MGHVAGDATVAHIQPDMVTLPTLVLLGVDIQPELKREQAVVVVRTVAVDATAIAIDVAGFTHDPHPRAIEQVARLQITAIAQLFLLAYSLVQVVQRGQAIAQGECRKSCIERHLRTVIGYGGRWWARWRWWIGW